MDNNNQKENITARFEKTFSPPKYVFKQNISNELWLIRIYKWYTFNVNILPYDFFTRYVSE